MSVEKVREYLMGFGVSERVMEFEASTATVPLAALAVGVEEARIAKTLSFMDKEGAALLLVCAGDARVDNKRFKEAFGMKAKMLKPQEAQDLTGHMVGGVCPFALKGGVRVFLDEGLKRFESVFPAAGSANSAVELSMDELEKTTGGKWVSVCSIPETE